MKKILGVFTVVLTLFVMVGLSDACLYCDYDVDNHGGKGGNATATVEKGAIDVDNRNNIHNNNHNNNNNKNVNVNLTRNTNDNTNLNTNRNTNVQGQLQGQMQGQLQGQNQSLNNENDLSNRNNVSNDVNSDSESSSYSDSNAASNAEVEFHEGDQNFEQTFEATEIPQSFANGVEMNYAPLPGHIGPDSPDGSVLPLELLVGYKPIWNRTTLEANCEDADIRLRSRSFVPRVDGEENPGDEIEIVYGRPTTEMTILGVVVAEADDLYTTNMELMSRAALEGFEMGADAVYIIIDGASKVTKSSGWGIGLNHTTTTLNGNGDIGTVNSGGTGYSKGEAGYRQKPWIQIFVVKY